MQSKINSIKTFLFRKRIIIPAVFLVLIGSYVVFREDPNLKNIALDTARTVDLRQTVLATGQVVSETDLDLSFNATGVIKTLNVKVGDQVKKGAILAKLDQSSVLASVTSARGSLAAAQAKYKRILEGSSNEEVSLAEIELTNAKRDLVATVRQQETLVKNAYNAMLSSSPEATTRSGLNDFEAPTVSGSYSVGKEGEIVITVFPSTDGGGFNVSGIATGSGVVTSTIPQPIGNTGLYIRFPSVNPLNVPEWVIKIPNKNAPNYLINQNAYEAALKTQESAVSQAEAIVDQRQAELVLKKARARQSDIDLAQADIINAQGGLQIAEAKYEDTILRAPEDGTITSIDVKIGELSEIQKKIMTLQDVSNVYIEAKINESNIANLKVGQQVSMTFDAFGPSVLFTGRVIHIDPSAVIGDGIVNYTIKASIDSQTDAIRSGMNADISILATEKNGVVAIPKAALVSENGNWYVNIVTDKKRKKYTPRQVTVGLTGDGNMIEITSGLENGTDIAIVSRS